MIENKAGSGVFCLPQLNFPPSVIAPPVMAEAVGSEGAPPPPGLKLLRQFTISQGPLVASQQAGGLNFSFQNEQGETDFINWERSRAGTLPGYRPL